MSKRNILSLVLLTAIAAGCGKDAPERDTAGAEPAAASGMDAAAASSFEIVPGLTARILREGEGDAAEAGDNVEVHYTGWTTDGKMFDSSVKRGQPASFPLNGVIKGWTEALLMMPVGSKWKLFIPAELAYGERAQRNIPANSTLLFDIELVDIKAGESAPPAPPAPGTPGAPKITVQPK